MAYSRSSYPTCDTYFVETDNYTAPRFDAKEHAKHIARERQRFMADELSRQAEAEYKDDILEHMIEMDHATLPDVDSIDIQTEIKWYMRPYLLDFLVEAHSAFQLLPSTLFLTINLLDRYCSKRVVYKRHYQLVGCAALLIAAKYGDKKERVPTIKELKSMCCSLYDDDMFIQMEWHVLQTLGWQVGHPTVDEFLQIAILGSNCSRETEHMALYILEIALFHRDFVSKLSADLAKSALALARCILGLPQPLHTEWAAQYNSATLISLSQQLHQPSRVLSRKYATQHFSRVSKTLEQFLARQATAAAAQNPPSPPQEIATSSRLMPGGEPAVLATPHKNAYNAPVHGYPTPPITPDGQSLAPYATKPSVTSAPRIVTPSPSPSAEAQFQSHQQWPPYPVDAHVY